MNYVLGYKDTKKNVGAKPFLPLHFILINKVSY